jgi:hypothetical protein
VVRQGHPENQEVCAMFEHVAHPGLRALLSFESQRHQTPIEFRECSDFPPSTTPFCPRIEVIAYCGSETGTVDLLAGDTTLAYEGPLASALGRIDESIHVGDTMVGGVTGNRIILRLSLETLFRLPEQQPQAGPDPTKPSINPAHKVFDAIFSHALPLALRNIREYDWKTEAESYVRAKLEVLDRSIRSWREEIQRNDRDLEDMTWKITGLASRNERLREALAGFENHTRMEHRRRAVEEHGALLRMLASGAIRNLLCSSDSLEFQCGPVTIDDGDYEYALGPYRVTMDLADGTLRIFGLRGCTTVDGYSHPHVSTSGIPCLGNMAPVIAKTLGTGDVVGAVGTILEFIRSYSHGNAYIELRRWNPDYEDDEDRFESCYDNSPCHDCVVCGDDACPYRDGSERRCWENHEPADCIACGDCGYRETAIENCRSDHSCWECTECEQSGCPYAGDVRACHEENRCDECPLTDCRHHPSHESAPESETRDAQESP